jgi:hypothetical protein
VREELQEQETDRHPIGLIALSAITPVSTLNRFDVVGG